MDIAFSTIKELHEFLDTKKISAVELAKEFLTRIKKYDKDLKAFITVTEEEALAQAREADQAIAAGEAGIFTGIPFTAKDLFSTRGIKTTAASKILENFQPVYDATVIRKLKDQKAVLLGKTNLDQFAHGSSTETSYFGPTHNPWDLNRIPGGSSGGSVAAVAAGLAPFALATETGGSIRQPASLCGISGWKPTYGRVSRHGVIAMTSSTDSIGAVARTVEDLALVAEILSGFDPKDSTTSKKDIPSWSKMLGGSLDGLKIGVPKEYFVSGIEPDVEKRVKEAIEEIRRLGATIKSVSLPLTTFGSMVYAIVTPSEVSSNLSRYDGIKYGYVTTKAKELFQVYSQTRGEGFGDEAKRRIMTGTYALSAGYRDQYYLKAQKVRRLLVNEFVEVFKEVDILVCPSSPNVALKIGQAADDPLFGYIADQLNIPAALAGLPALSISCGFGKPKDGENVELPVGLQIIGPQWGEEKIFQVGHAYQQVTEFHKMRPRNL
ncbi:MAG: Asp-tRNA(Asn)/Glu-tRNA(Gln) amidotransferase subunit GatA [bacterium]|nr:Asp-tRNA(Asn)/Glu-tRNA(Gln) amidotransferase subunit GatA [bacterium]MDZ4346887.1 Asp-tRNA(Asn)/Glu-tRNA(Gln) amidotransferase subunit GatA [Candidatus Binatia bacterium]